MIDLSLIILAVYITAIIVVGLFSSWEYAALLVIVFSVAPLILMPKAYIEFLQTPLIEDRLFVINNLTVLLLFNSAVLAYAYSAWVRTIFVLVFILVLMHQTGLLEDILNQFLPLGQILEFIKGVI